MSKDPISNLCNLFADLLEYPTLATPLKAGLCHEQLQASRSEAGDLLQCFSDETQKQRLQQLEELYTVTFDMQPVCYPYVGYHLFGESYKRGAFMAQLNEAYHASGYSAGGDLPDHLSVILRFLGLNMTTREDDFGQALLAEGLVPALEKMLQPFAVNSENPYGKLLSALHLFLVSTSEKEFDHA